MADKKTIVSTQKTVTAAGTAEALVSDPTWVRKIYMKALAGNAGVIYLGDSTVSSSNGYEVAAGVEIDLTSLLEEAEDNFRLDEIYIDAANNGDGVSFIYFQD